MNEEWISRSPTQPGPHFWRKDATGIVHLLWVTRGVSGLGFIVPACETFIEEHVTVDQWDGQWQRLVPAHEIEKAFNEGGDPNLDTSWVESRAFKISNGITE